MTDERVDIVTPDDRSEVRLPFTVDWTARDLAVGSGLGRFGVYVDRAPPPPGRTSAWLFRGENTCKGRGRDRVRRSGSSSPTARCIETIDTELTITNVRDLSGSDKRREFHEVTVVLLDAAGARVQESAWSVQVDVEGR